MLQEETLIAFSLPCSIFDVLRLESLYGDTNVRRQLDEPFSDN